MKSLSITVFLIVLLSFLLCIVKADIGNTVNWGNVNIVQYINITESGFASVNFNLEIFNDTNKVNFYSFQVSGNNQNYTNFNCDVAIKDLKNGSIRSYNSNGNIDYFIFGRERRTIWFNHTDDSDIQLSCSYSIANYAKEIAPGSWELNDDERNKHGSNFFRLVLYIPNNFIFTQISPTGEIEYCKSYGVCQPSLTFDWDKSGNNMMTPELNLRYEKVSLNLTETLRARGFDYVLGGVIGAIIGAPITILIDRWIRRKNHGKNRPEI